VRIVQYFSGFFSGVYMSDGLESYGIKMDRPGENLIAGSDLTVLFDPTPPKKEEI
jgi:hypothetical protein